MADPTYTYPLTRTALLALQAEANAFLAFTNGLAGVGAAAPYSPLDVMLHDTTLPVLGDTPPASYATTTVVAPLGTSTLIAGVQASAEAITATVLAGTTMDADGATAINALTASVSALQTASTNAIAGLRGALPDLAAEQAFAANMIQGSVAAQAYLALIVQPAALAQLQAAAEAQSYVAPVQLDPVAENIVLGDAVQGWVAA